MVNKSEFWVNGMNKMKIVLLTLLVSIILLLCGCDNSKHHSGANMNTASSDTTDSTSALGTTETLPTDLSGDDIDMNSSNIMLPKEAENAILDYLKCDSIDSLSDSVYPSSVAEEMKKGNLLQGNYFFAGFPCGAYENEEISECTRLTPDIAQYLAAFWAMGASLQGVPADFSAEDGYDVVVSATFTLDGEMEEMTLRVTRRLTTLKIIDDRWIIIPPSDTEAYNMEIIE